MAERQVLDWSNYTGIPTDAKIQQLMADGWDSVILGTQFPDITRKQYDACYRNNFPVEALYVFVYWDVDDWARLNQAKTLAAEWGLKIWLDCEWTKRGYPGSGSAPPPAEMVALIHQYKNMLGDQYLGIYTGRWWWPAYTNNCTDFAGDPLWHADYGISNPTAAFVGFMPYGGWNRPHIVQYSSNGTDGVTADLNEAEDWQTPPQPPVVGTFLFGDVQAGREVRGFQVIDWHLNVEIEAWGDLAGQFPGERWHNLGGTWVKEAA